MKAVTLAWFRQDLRVQDHPMLAEAVRLGRPLVPLYIHAPAEDGNWPPGGASAWWLHHALHSLQMEMGAVGLPLVIRMGPSLAALQEIVSELGLAGLSVASVLFSRLYEPAAAERDARIQRVLQGQGLEVKVFNATLLIEPEQVRNQSGKPFRVFTPFWKHLRTLPLETPVHTRTSALLAPAKVPRSESIDSLGLLPRIAWDKEFPRHWDPTLAGAANALHTFVKQAVGSYREQRNVPGVEGTSRLSPYLHWGQLSPRQVWAAVHAAGEQDGGGGHTFLSEVAWREFAYHLLQHFPDSPEQAMKPAFRTFPWQPDEAQLLAWQQGQTGYPLVDAGMRQLWQTGWMHNRVRMVVASFLVKHQLQPWQEGARWFWDTLVDADLASNTMGWQWVAGCGADAAPYFRIFNPVTQGEKFDPQGDYVRRFVPQLARLPTEFIHQPWLAPREVLAAAGVTLGKNYPLPVIDHRIGRERALAALAENKLRQRN